MLGVMSDPTARVPRRSKVLFRALLLLASTTLTLAGLELALRFAKGAGLAERPDPTAGVSMIGHVYPGRYDPYLGYVPTPGAVSYNPVWQTRARIDWKGLRSNGVEGAGPRGVPVLAVGDSFTYGDEVDDRDTWPAALERLLDRPVRNGGVFGYGFDQIVLRSEVLLDTVPADWLIVSLIADDVDRCEYSYRYGWKPYFDVVEEELVRRNAPVPRPDERPPGDRGLRRILRASFLADFVLRRIDPADWLVRGSVRVHDRGEDVSLLLVDRLAEHAQARGHRILLLVQWVPGTSSRRTDPLVARAHMRGIDVLLLEAPLREEINASGSSTADFFHVREVNGAEQVGHMSASGNRWVAARIARHVADRGADREPVPKR